MDEYLGFHRFHGEDGEHGSFEVFHHDRTDRPDIVGDLPCMATGFYWWACLPGCLPDNDSDGFPHGPFPTAKEAHDGAQENA